MIKFDLIVMTGVLVLASNAFAQEGAGGGVGNGGGAVVCRDSKGIIQADVETMDRYEARMLRGLRPSFSMSFTDADQPNEKLEAFLTEMFKRLARFSPLRAQEYQEWSKSFFKDATFLKGQTLTFVADSEHVSVPNGCHFEQLVIQRVPEFPEDGRYIINEDLWKAMKPLDRAIIVVHEMMVREMIQAYSLCTREPILHFGMKVDHCPEIQTKELRYLNSIIFSDKISKMNYDQFYQVIKKVPNLEFDEHPQVTGRIPRLSVSHLQSAADFGMVGYVFGSSCVGGPPRYQRELIGVRDEDQWLIREACESNYFVLRIAPTEFQLVLNDANSSTYARTFVRLLETTSQGRIDPRGMSRSLKASGI